MTFLRERTANSIKSKLSWTVELIQKTIFASILSKGRIRNVSGAAKSIKLKLSGQVEGDV